MIHDNAQPNKNRNHLWRWLNFGLTAVLLAFGVYYLITQVGLAEIQAALRLANGWLILLSLLAMVVTLVMKTWRWQLLLAADTPPPPFWPAFWALMLGQHVNLVLPLLRLGEVARIYALNQQTAVGKARSLGTLVVEKTLELFVLALTMVLLLPLLVLPAFVSQPGLTSIVVGVAALALLYLLAFQTAVVIRLVTRLTGWLPNALQTRLVNLVVAGLDGLASLRDRRLALGVILLSLLSGFLAVLTPYFLLLAFRLPFGLAEAALIHVVVTIALTPPSTPGKIGVFDGATAFMLLRFGLDAEPLIISYTLVYHAVVVVPQVILGSVAASRTNWRRRAEASR